MSDHFAALHLFARVARLGSFSEAGRETGVPQSTVSRTVAALERKIGARLLVRTTRAVTMTDAGAEFLARLEPLLDGLAEAEQSARGADELRGALRVATGLSLGVREIVPRLADFMALHPGLTVDLALEDRHQDLVAEGFDVALRFGPLADSTATARFVRAWPRVLVASPAYLKKAGVPTAPADLASHALIVGSIDANQRWTFHKGKTETSIRVDGRLKVRASEAAVAAATAGLGVIRLTEGACRRELESGALVRILDDWDLGTIDLSAVFPAGRAAKRAAHVFVDYLIGALRNDKPAGAT
jgi:DNA-binding transcriptional LysR family regulator